ncbi:MAG: hypothetical protein K0R47_627 [Brevibacillus sp.]|nr:hypothetical protein [Brevibacillus sp.]
MGVSESKLTKYYVLRASSALVGALPRTRRFSKRGSGGRVLPLRTAIQRASIRGSSTDAIITRLRRVALLAASRLATYYTHQRVFGLDMGIDANGRVRKKAAAFNGSLSFFQEGMLEIEIVRVSTKAFVFI